MEFIEGETLGARLRQGPRLDMHDVVELSRQMLRGLAAAHGVGVLHRDFKSDNVMLRTKAGAPDELHAVIMDFGLARVLGDQAHRLTERHEFIGSAAYMAPEQLEEGASLSAATDVYAFGVVLFEMLTGRLPFEGKGAVAVALRRLTHAAPPPSLYVPELSTDWDALIARCLHRDVSRRFASTEEVATALEGTAVARHVALPTRRSRRRALTLAGAALATASVALAAAHFWPQPEAPVAEATPPQSTTLALQPPVEPARADAPAPLAELPPLTAEPAPARAPDPVPEPAPDPAPPARAHRPAPRATPPKPRAVAAVEPAAAAAAANPAVPAPVQPPRDVRDIFFLEPPSDGPAQNAPE
jgi:serine/threonine-protein kinase